MSGEEYPAGEVEPENDVPGEVVPGEVVPGEVGPDDDVPGEVGPENDVPGEVRGAPSGAEDGAPSDEGEVTAPADPFATADGVADDVAIADEEIAKVAAERDEYLDALRRLQAEFENFRKRTARQQSETLERASEAVIQRLLPALDALDLALAHVGAHDESGGDLDAAFVKIGSLLRDVLAKEGLERIDSTGVAFDPTLHDAVAHVAADEEEASQVGDPVTAGPAVVETLRVGYRLKGRVLRPAMVKVRA